MVEYSIHNPKIEGLNPAIGALRKKIAKTVEFGHRYLDHFHLLLSLSKIVPSFVDLG